MTRRPTPTRYASATALGVVAVIALAGWAAVPAAAAQGRATNEPEPDPLPGWIDALFGEDETAAASAYDALLTADLPHDVLADLARAAEGPEQLATARGIARHHVLTRLREEELADLEDDTVIVGFTFLQVQTAGNTGPDADDLAELYPTAAQVNATTAGFPGYAYLRPGDLIVRIDGEPLPEDAAAVLQHVIDTVKAHTLDQPVAMTVIRGAELLELTIPLARAAALPRMYDARTLRRDLIDPFRFLWDEAWSTILLDAGYDEPPPGEADAPR